MGLGASADVAGVSLGSVRGAVMLGERAWGTLTGPRVSPA